ncbi:MAG: DUF21 domain-containing protein [Planctomycetes bacterium]|nr:DUF21 domain-containing protein [Planctomycetota bacterium]
MMLIALVIPFVVLAAVFSGAETGMYQLSRLRLRIGVEKKHFLSVVLSKSLHDQPSMLLSMLLGTNISHYAATSIITYMLLRHVQAEHTAELLATLIIAPVLFVFSEVIPKNIFFYRADFIMPFVSPILFAFHKFFTWLGIVPFLRYLSRIFASLTGSSAASQAAINVNRIHIKAIVKEVHEEGLLSTTQTDIINRLVDISNIHIKSVMIPIRDVSMVDINSDRNELLKKLQKYSFTRFPVYENSAVNIIGFINIYETLISAEPFENLRKFIKPIRKLSSETSVTDATNFVKNESQPFILVTKANYAGRDKPVGIVTMKDLVEELLGDLAEW